MRVRKSTLRKVIREEMAKRQLKEECPSGLPCPVAAAAEIKEAGATPEEMLDWIAKLTQELLSPVERGQDLTSTEQPPLDGPGTMDLDSLVLAGDEY